MSTLAFEMPMRLPDRLRNRTTALSVATAVAMHGVVVVWILTNKAHVESPLPPVPAVVELVELPRPLPASAQPEHATPEPAKPRPPIAHTERSQVRVTPEAHRPVQAAQTARAAPSVRSPESPQSPSPTAASALPSAAAASASTERHVDAPSADEPITAPIGNAAYLHNPTPDYPRVAREHEWQGQVVLHVHVLASGRPDRVELQTTSGHGPLDDAAISAVKNWLFLPAKRGNTAIDGWVSVPVNFNLSN
ncbi:TonB family protein [Paraburkholderia sediminicola]|jgi:protein TonB|uniref:energy transducer TonB n=1 Tax=Paraburkholderia sediminicola TaxID=458836 RepID=UPI0038B6C3CD